MKGLGSPCAAELPFPLIASSGQHILAPCLAVPDASQYEDLDLALDAGGRRE